jgi:hypothetical protein
MTILAAKYNGSIACMGADSGAFEEEQRWRIAHEIPKVWKAKDNTLVGVCGSFYIMELVEGCKKTDPYAIRDYLQEQEHVPWLDPNADWGVLVATPDYIYEIGSDGGVWGHHDSYAAQGHRDAVGLALGSMSTTHTSSPRRSVELALKAAVKHSVKCMEPFSIVSTNE